MLINIQGLECECVVSIHDTSVTGIRYKLTVTFPKRIGAVRRYRGPITMHMPKAKPRRDVLGPLVLDTGNALYRQLQFRYGIYPQVSYGKGVTYLEYFFNDCLEAKRLGYVEENGIQHILKHETAFAAQGYTNFVAPYKR